jgi:uncharacterized membrane protein
MTGVADSEFKRSRGRVNIGLFLIGYLPLLLLQTTQLLPGGKNLNWLPGDVLFLGLLLFATFKVLYREISKTTFYFLAVVFVLTSLIYFLNDLIGYPFGEMMSSREIVFGSTYPWFLPLWWIVIFIPAYVVASVILVQGKVELVQESKILVLLLAGGITALIQATCEPIGANMKQYWFWLEREHSYYGTPRTNLVGWYIVGVLLAWILSKKICPSMWKISTAWLSLGLLSSIALLSGLMSWQVQFYIPVFISINLIGVLTAALLIIEHKK